MLVELGTEFEVERVLDVCVVRGNRSFLMKWKGCEDYNNTWVLESDMGNAAEAV